MVSVLKCCYYQTPFPDPVVRDTEFCKHINCAADLKKAAIQFKNCLRQYYEEGIRGEYQYYRWYKSGRPVAVISIREDHPFGWRISEVKTKGNGFPEEELMADIRTYFGQFEIHAMPSLERLLNELGGTLNRGGRRRDPVDQINGVIDELLEGEFA